MDPTSAIGDKYPSVGESASSASGEKRALRGDTMASFGFVEF